MRWKTVSTDNDGIIKISSIGKFTDSTNNHVIVEFSSINWKAVRTINYGIVKDY